MFAYQAVKLTSIKAQLPYDYYTLPFCRPDDGKLHYKPENLGEKLSTKQEVIILYIFS